MSPRHAVSIEFSAKAIASALVANNARSVLLDRRQPEPVKQNENQELDGVEEASLESFPASNPPA
jgi:hypothetical protein